MSERFMVVYFTEQQSEGLAVPDWPQHITVVPWAEGDIETTTDSLADMTAGWSPLEASIGEEAMFGSGRDIPVKRVEPQKELTDLHDAVLAVIEERARLAVGRECVGSLFRPHITLKPGQPETRTGDIFLLDELTVVQQMAHGLLPYKHIQLGSKSGPGLPGVK